MTTEKDPPLSRRAKKIARAGLAERKKKVHYFLIRKGRDIGVGLWPAEIRGSGPTADPPTKPPGGQPDFQAHNQA